MIICDGFLKKLFSCFLSRLLSALCLRQKESDAWDLESALTSHCKLCSMVTSFLFQFVLYSKLPARLFGTYAYLVHVDLRCLDVL